MRQKKEVSLVFNFNVKGFEIHNLYNITIIHILFNIVQQSGSLSLLLLSTIIIIINNKKWLYNDMKP